MSKTKTTKYRHIANPERAAAMHALGSSSAASSHNDSRTKRARTRSAATKRAIRDFS